MQPKNAKINNSKNKNIRIPNYKYYIIKAWTNLITIQNHLEKLRTLQYFIF